MKYVGRTWTGRPRVLALAAVVGLSLALAACGEDSQSSGGAPNTIKFGVITAVGSPLTNYPDIEVASRAGVEAINKNGGVNGKQVEFVFCNTRGDANQAVACGRQMDAENVAAVVGRVDVFSAQTLPVLEKAGIPDIGTVSTGADVDFKSPAAYPLTPGNFGAYTALPHGFKEAGAKKMVVVTVDLPIGILQGEFAEKVAKDIGLEVAPMIKVPAQGITDYSPYAQQVKDSGADASIVAIGPAGFQAYVKAADGIGSKAVIGGTAFTFGQSEAAGVGALADKMLVTSPYPSTNDSTVAGVAQYNKELDDAGVKKSISLRRLAGLNAWLSMHAAAKVAGTIEGSVDRASMTAALRKSRDIDLFGLATYSPSELTTDQKTAVFPRFPAVDYHVLTFKDGKMVDAGQPIVADPLAPVRKPGT